MNTRKILFVLCLLLTSISAFAKTEVFILGNMDAYGNRNVDLNAESWTKGPVTIHRNFQIKDISVSDKGVQLNAFQNFNVYINKENTDKYKLDEISVESCDNEDLQLLSGSKRTDCLSNINKPAITFSAKGTAYRIIVHYETKPEDQLSIVAFRNGVGLGNVLGSGYYKMNDEATLTVSTVSNYHFLRWNDGNTDNPRTVTVTGNAEYQAYYGSCDRVEEPSHECLKSEATCSQKAKYYYVCSYCKSQNTDWYEYGELAGHDYSSKSPTSEYEKSPTTCTQLGEYYYKCKWCSLKGTETYVGESLLPHEFNTKITSDDYRKSDATCTQKAQYLYKCDNCDAKSTNTYEDGEVMPHKYIDKVLSVAADDNGLYSYTCNYGCGTADAGHKIIKDFAPGSNLQLDMNSDGSYSTSQAIALTDANNIADVNVAFTTTSAPTYTRQMSSAQWGTMVLPFDVKVSEQNDFELYKVENFGGDNILLTKNEGDANGIIAAGTPTFILRKGEGTNISVTAANNAVNTELKNVAGFDYTLTGNYESLKDISSCNGYVMANDNFWSIAYLTQAPEGEQAKKVGVGPFRAYIASNVVSNAKLQVLTDESTSIKQYATGMVGGLKEGKRLENGRIVIVRNSKKYNVNGQEVK